MATTLSRIALGGLILATVLLGGCDKEKGASGQPQASPQASADDGTVPEVGKIPVSQNNKASNYSIDRTQSGKPVPDIAFVGEDDSAVSIADFKGKPVLLNLWATWCAPCVKEMPTLDALAAKTGDRLQVVTVSQDLKGAEAVDPFFAKHRFTKLKPYLDPEVKLSLGLNAPGLPVTVLIDAQGNEVWRIIGDLDWMGPQAQRLLAEAGV